MIGVAEDEEEGPTVPGFDDVSVASDGNEHGDADGADNGNVLEDESSNEQDGGNNGGACSVRNQDAFFYFFTHKVYMQARPRSSVPKPGDCLRAAGSLTPWFAGAWHSKRGRVRGPRQA